MVGPQRASDGAAGVPGAREEAPLQLWAVPVAHRSRGLGRRTRSTVGGRQEGGSTLGQGLRAGKALAGRGRTREGGRRDPSEAGRPFRPGDRRDPSGGRPPPRGAARGEGPDGGRGQVHSFQPAARREDVCEPA